MVPEAVVAVSTQQTTACRSCGSECLHPVIDLGQQPLANSYRTPDDGMPEALYPLAVVCCESCSLLQLTYRVDPTLMFDDYRYLSSYSTGMVEEMRDLAASLVTDRALGAGSLVVEIASNDGYLLQHYLTEGVAVLGVEPAERPALLARERGVTTRIDYFTEALAGALVAERQPADVLHANNVLAHVPDINDFVAGIAALLARDGVAVIETPYAVDMLAQNAFDTIYHEHVFYYSATALQVLFTRHGLAMSGIERVRHHGGSLRLRVVHGDQPGADAAALLDQERAAGVGSEAWTAGFALAAERVCDGLRTWLEEQRSLGRRVAGYGAAAKGTVLLNHAGIGVEDLTFVVDRNPAKQGRLMPGTGQPVLDVDQLLAHRPDSLLVLAWNHADEVYAQLGDYRAQGGQLFVAVPRVRALP